MRETIQKQVIVTIT